MALIAILVGLACIGVSVMIFVEFGRVKAQAGTNAALAKVRDELRNLAIVQLVSGVILTMLGFLYLHSGKGQEEIKGTYADTHKYVHQKFRNFKNQLLDQELIELEKRRNAISGRVEEYRKRLSVAPKATGKMGGGETNPVANFGNDSLLR